MNCNKAISVLPKDPVLWHTHGLGREQRRSGDQPRRKRSDTWDC